MFDHVTIRVSDRAAAEAFYGLVLSAIGIAETNRGENFTEWDEFSLAAADDEHPVTRRLHIGFLAPSRAHVDEFWRVGTESDYRDDGAPGPRPQYSPDYYGAFLLDPDGNSAEAVHHGDRRTGVIDHLWIRVANLDAATRFYRTLAPHAGFSSGRPISDPPRTIFEERQSGSFTVVDDGEPTEHAHLAFPATDNAAVERFHRALTDAGYRDNGAPGERPVYHPGYYGAFVLDPDGNNVELVNHNR